MGAAQALKDGLVDEIVEGDLTAGAIAFAKKLVAEKAPLRRASRMEDKLAALRADPGQYNEIAAKALGEQQGPESADGCRRCREDDAVRATVEEALKHDATYSSSCSPRKSRNRSGTPSPNAKRRRSSTCLPAPRRAR